MIDCTGLDKIIKIEYCFTFIQKGKRLDIKISISFYWNGFQVEVLFL